MIYLVFSSSSLSDVLSYIVLCGLLVLVLSSPDVPLSPCMLLMCLVWKGGFFFLYSNLWSGTYFLHIQVLL